MVRNTENTARNSQYQDQMFKSKIGFQDDDDLQIVKKSKNIFGFEKLLNF